MYDSWSVSKFAWLTTATVTLALACGSGRSQSGDGSGGATSQGGASGGPVLLCSNPSSCGNRQYCDTAKNCICIQSAEGLVRCGAVPSSCGVQECKTSADCANLGSGYFCDTPNSGCCDQASDQHQRCIAPCEVAAASGGSTSGGSGGANGASGAGTGGASGGASDVSSRGTWTGSTQATNSIPVGIRFVLSEQDGNLTGLTYVEDPETGDFLRDADITGSRNGSSATWTTSTGLTIRGTFSGASFVGTLEYPSDGDFAPLVSNLTLNR